MCHVTATSTVTVPGNAEGGKLDDVRDLAFKQYLRGARIV